MRWYHWLWLPLVAIAGAVAFALGRRSKPTSVVTEISAVELKAKVASMVAERDAESARLWVETEYAETIKRLDQRAADTARRLRGDPVRLAEYLYRASL